jgi:CO/xanthine dehydrogenase Mo-binding subunit
VTVHKLVVVQDVGQVINPLTLEGQIMGGAMQGLGWALYEQMAHDELRHAAHRVVDGLQRAPLRPGRARI